MKRNTRNTRNKKRISRIGLVSVAAVLGLLTTSAALYALGDDRSVDIDTQYAVEEQVYSINNADVIELPEEQLDADAMDLAMINLDAGDVDMARNEVPEPATMAMLGLGGLGLLRRRRRNRK